MGSTITANGVRRIAMEQILEVSSDWTDWTGDDAANSRNAFYIAGIAALCQAICEKLKGGSGRIISAPTWAHGATGERCRLISGWVQVRVLLGLQMGK